MARACGIAAVALAAGCSFAAGPVAVDPTVDAAAGDAAIDTPPPITCGDLTCDPNATCGGDPVGCTCATGFSGDGMSCVDVDECAAGTAGCAAACENTSGSFACYAPQTCTEVLAHVPGFAGGAVTLYAGGDAAKPWTAFCSDTMLEYLTLSSANNYSQYSRNPGASVRTTFTRIRIIPATLMVDIDDKRFSTSTGSLPHAGAGGVTVTSMPYAVAMDCEGNNSNSGLGAIDLTGTPFIVSDPFATRGVSVQGGAQPDNGGRRVTLEAGGNCGWISPEPAPFNPFNSIGPSPILDLTYAP